MHGSGLEVLLARGYGFLDQGFCCLVTELYSVHALMNWSYKKGTN